MFIPAPCELLETSATKRFSEFAQVQQGEYFPADIVSNLWEVAEEADAYMFPLDKTRNFTSWSFSKKRGSPPSVWLLWRRAPPGETSKEGHLPSQHFKDEDAESPPVHRPAMAFALDDFRGQVLWGAAQSPRPEESKNTNIVAKLSLVSFSLPRLHFEWLKSTAVKIVSYDKNQRH